MKSLGIIGFGRFGQLLFEQLRQSVQVVVSDPVKEAQPEFSDVPFVSPADVCRQELVILAVPVKTIENVAKTIAPLLDKGSIVMDVCAVKTYPLGVLENHLPPEVSLLGSHPLFGPDSVRKSMKDHLMILCPARISQPDLQRIRNFWKRFGLQLIEMTPDDQDRLMAWTLAMTHFLGRSLADLPLPDTGIATRDYQNLIQLMRKINRDTWDLFEDMHLYNPYTADMRNRLMESMHRLKEQLDQSQITKPETE